MLISMILMTIMWMTISKFLMPVNVTKSLLKSMTKFLLLISIKRAQRVMPRTLKFSIPTLFSVRIMLTLLVSLKLGNV